MISEIEKSFYLVYQPIVDKFKNIVKYEVLLRWDFDHVKLSPQQLIDWAEDDIQAIIQLDTLIFNRFVNDFNSFKLKSEVKFCLNSSPITLALDPDYMSKIDYVIKRTALRSIEIEVLESKVDPDLELSIQMILEQIRQKGIGVSLDDFGNGHACVRKLTHNYTNIKIDGELIAKIHRCKNTRKIVTSVIKLAHALGKTVTAEKIETNEQYIELLRLECDYFQGFYFGRAMLPKDIKKTCAVKYCSNESAV